MGKKEEFKKSYDHEKPINIRDILTDSDWKMEDIDYDSKSGKYRIKASHIDGRVVSLKRNRQYVDNLVKELEDAKAKR